MRDYFFNINQVEALKLRDEHIDLKGKSKINIEDFILIRRIGDFILSSKTVSVILEKEIYHWVNYETLQNDLPLVFPSVVSLKKRIEKLKKIGILTNKKLAVKKTEFEKLGFKSPGNYSVIKFPNEVKKLFDVAPCTLEGVKGKPLEGVKACTLEGVNKEYHEDNTEKDKNNTKTLGEQVKELSISNNLKDKFIEYIKFRKSIKKSLNTMRPITSSINQIGKKFKSEQHLIESLDYSMDNEYQGIVPTKGFNNKNNQTETQNFERTVYTEDEDSIFLGRG